MLSTPWVSESITRNSLPGTWPTFILSASGARTPSTPSILPGLLTSHTHGDANLYPGTTRGWVPSFLKTRHFWPSLQLHLILLFRLSSTNEGKKINTPLTHCSSCRTKVSPTINFLPDPTVIWVMWERQIGNRIEKKRSCYPLRILLFFTVSNVVPIFCLSLQQHYEVAVQILKYRLNAISTFKKIVANREKKLRLALPTCAWLHSNINILKLQDLQTAIISLHILRIQPPKGEKPEVWRSGQWNSSHSLGLWAQYYYYMLS